MNFCRDNLNARIVTCAIKIVGLKTEKIFRKDIKHNSQLSEGTISHAASRTS